jgi:CRISPR-associated endonuclease Csn1
VPWVGFREELAEVVRRIVVSHKPDHGREAGLHNDTNYGKRGEPNASGAMLVSVRKPLTALTPKNVDAVADSALRDELKKLLDGLSGKELKAALDAYSTRTGVRRVRMEERLSVIPIEDCATRQPYRYVKGDGNYCYDIFRADDGKWGAEIVDIYTANRSDFRLDSKSAYSSSKPLVMRLRKGDVIKIEHDGRHKLMRVALFSSNGIALHEHYEANVDARDRNREDEFSYMRKGADPLRKIAARLVGVDILGYVNDPGFKE